MEDGETGVKNLVHLFTILTTAKNSTVTRETNKKRKGRDIWRCLISQTRRMSLPKWRLASMVKESPITILKETSCYVAISLGRNFGTCEIRATSGALTIVIVTRWASGGLAETKPGTCLRRRGKKITYPACKPPKRERPFGPSQNAHSGVARRCRLRAARRRPLRRTRRKPCCHPAALRSPSRLRLPSQSRRCATVASRER